MSLRRNMETEQARRFWKNVDEAAERVEGWPEWKRQDDNPMRRQLEEASRKSEDANKE